MGKNKMKISGKLILLAILASSTMGHIYEPLITKDHIEKLKTKVGFEVYDFETHPFKNWSIMDLQKILRTQIKKNDFTVLYGDSTGLPESFDSRTQWPDC